MWCDTPHCRSARTSRPTHSRSHRHVLGNMQWRAPCDSNRFSHSCPALIASLAAAPASAGAPYANTYAHTRARARARTHTHITDTHTHTLYAQHQISTAAAAAVGGQAGEAGGRRRRREIRARQRRGAVQWKESLHCLLAALPRHEGEPSLRALTRLSVGPEHPKHHQHSRKTAGRACHPRQPLATGRASHPHGAAATPRCVLHQSLTSSHHDASASVPQ